MLKKILTVITAIIVTSFFTVDKGNAMIIQYDGVDYEFGDNYIVDENYVVYKKCLVPQAYERDMPFIAIVDNYMRESIRRKTDIRPAFLYGEWVIPSSIDGLPVMDIEMEACVGEQMTSIIFPDGFKEIGFGSFYNCKNLEYIYIYQKV